MINDMSHREYIGGTRQCSENVSCFLRLTAIARGHVLAEGVRDADTCITGAPTPLGRITSTAQTVALHLLVRAECAHWQVALYEIFNHQFVSFGLLQEEGVVALCTPRGVVGSLVLYDADPVIFAHLSFGFWADTCNEKKRVHSMIILRCACCQSVAFECVYFRASIV